MTELNPVAVIVNETPVAPVVERRYLAVTESCFARVDATIFVCSASTLHPTDGVWGNALTVVNPKGLTLNAPLFLIGMRKPPSYWLSATAGGRNGGCSRTQGESFGWQRFRHIVAVSSESSDVNGSEAGFAFALVRPKVRSPVTLIQKDKKIRIRILPYSRSELSAWAMVIDYLPEGQRCVVRAVSGEPRSDGPMHRSPVCRGLALH